MSKAVVYACIVVAAMAAAGLFGVVHNQISYSVAPEYFTKFKFRQFGLTETELPERVRASIVGFLASWWMGVPIGLLVGAAGLMHREPRQMLRVSLWSLLVAMGFTLVFGLAGLLHGVLETRELDPAQYRGWFIPDDVADLRRFLCAGFMHNASYLGGALSVGVAWAFHAVVRARNRTAELAKQA